MSERMSAAHRNGAEALHISSLVGRGGLHYELVHVQAVIMLRIRDGALQDLLRIAGGLVGRVLEDHESLRGVLAANQR